MFTLSKDNALNLRCLTQPSDSSLLTGSLKGSLK